MIKRRSNTLKRASQADNKKGPADFFGRYTATEAPKDDRRVFLDKCALPAGYNTTSVTLIARDPYWIYAYWEIARSSIEELREKIGGELDSSSYVLRMYDVTYIDFNGNNANHWFDIHFKPGTNNWYINLQRDNAVFCADLGVRTPDGRFFALARSNFVTTPRASASGRTDTIWMEVKGNAGNAPFVIAQTQEEKKSKANGHTSSGGVSRAGAKVSRRRIYLSEDDIRAYYSRLFPLLKHVLSGRLATRSGRKFYVKDAVKLEEFIRRGLSKDEFVKRLLLGSSQALLMPGASERQEKKRQFFFEIGTELIVYGRTQVGAQVWLGDRKIQLNDDGTFALRFALPDGKIPLEFSAQSKDKLNKRNIKTSVERAKTEYIP